MSLFLTLTRIPEAAMGTVQAKEMVRDDSQEDDNIPLNTIRAKVSLGSLAECFIFRLTSCQAF